MNKMRKHKITALILCSFLSLTKCQVKEEGYQYIQDYFSAKKWDFPIEFSHSTLSTKYYGSNISTPAEIPISYEVNIRKIEKIYNDSERIRGILKRTLIDSSYDKTKGFKISIPTITIDTSVFGTINEPRFYLSFTFSTYKINIDALNHGIPCEGCILEENGKILRYPNGLFFELSKTTDSLVFSRWDL
jgi:hypothetical protein